jgi:RNA polymerase sigma-32 factor
VIERYLNENPPTLRELAQKYGISPERVRQIEQRALERLRCTIKSERFERRLAANCSDAGAAASVAA